jgi:hypothetical protein
MDAFTVALAAIVLAVVFFIARTVRLTRSQIDDQLRGTDPRRREDVMRDLATRIREESGRIRCVRCGGPAFMVLGTGQQYTCEVCHLTFDGPLHMPEE